MSDYLIVFASGAEKQLASLPVEIRNRIYPKIDSLANNPRPPGCVKLKGEKNGWRIRVGEYRVIYSIDDNTQTVDVTKVGHRRDIY
ncbi:MAG: type II toxin-antitoxin system RelE/ParE family toxin [Okeania sp. SIO2H7]|nr:type II toxin-antitoxin system RelE/ParE family toxin [Okeania sp. SIO2H7]